MTISEMFIECFSTLPIGTELSRQEIVQALQNKYVIKEYSILPSDMCYNSSNKGVEGKDNIRLFLKKARGVYIYVGQNFDAKGINPHEYGTVGEGIPLYTIGKYDSWTIKSEKIAIKETDKSVFEHHESVIPKEIRWYFDADDMRRGDKRDIILIYEDAEHKAYIKRESEYGRTRISWYSDLSSIINKIFVSSDNYPLLVFEKIEYDRYLISIMDNDKEKFIEALDDTYSQEERERQAIEMDFESLKMAAESHFRKDPEKKESIVSQIARDPYIAEYAKRRANGICQLCCQKAPFTDKKGKPYLESHHIIWLSRGGEDSVYNTVALCPNCHKKMHVLDDEKDVELLKKSVASICKQIIQRCL